MARIIAVAILSQPTKLLKYLCQVTSKIKPAAPVANTIKYKGIDRLEIIVITVVCHEHTCHGIEFPACLIFLVV